MSDLRTRNLNQLQRQFFEQTTAPQAQSEFFRFRSRDAGALADADLEPFRLPGEHLGHLLRDHRVEKIVEQREVRLRDSFDELLAYYSLLELACMVGIVPVPLPQELAREALELLEDEDLLRYYQTHYPLLLPRLFRLRLRGKHDLRLPPSPAPAARYMEFLDVNALIERDPDVDTFLWFLDDGKLDDYSLADTLRVLSKPEELVERLCREEQERGVVDRSVHGFREFLVFCTEFYDLLERTREFPLLQSGFWHFHAYWFDFLGKKVGRDLDNAIAQFAAWQFAPDSEEMSEDSRDSLKHLSEVVARLTSGEYAAPLRRALG